MTRDVGPSDAADLSQVFGGRLLEIRGSYDPDNLFRVHHGVGDAAAN
jgi:hypothetical protein